jgi:hypothetical protein
VDLLAIPGFGPQVGGPGLERNVADQLGELTVTQNTGQVLTQGVAGLAFDLIDAVNQLS